MRTVTLTLDDATLLLYTRIADSLGIRTEALLADALFLLAGELSLEAIAARNRSSL